jgi:hypothetical protein
LTQGSASRESIDTTADRKEVAMSKLLSTLAKASVVGAGWELGKRVGSTVWDGVKKSLQKPWVEEYKEVIRDAFRDKPQQELHEKGTEQPGYFARARKEHEEAQADEADRAKSAPEPEAPEKEQPKP